MELRATEPPVPVWFGHGREDLKVKMHWGTSMSNVLSDLRMKVNFNVYSR